MARMRMDGMDDHVRSRLPLLLLNLPQEVLRQDDDRPVCSADVLQNLSGRGSTILLMGSLVMLKMASSLREFLRSFSMK
jgi:hypothetical protein